MNRAARELWQHWAEGRLCIQRCDACGATQHPPGPVCGRCHATSLSFPEISGDAELVAWSTVYRAPSAAFRAQVPYTLAIVRLAGGALVEVRLDTSPDGDDAETWKVGQYVRLGLGTVNGRDLPLGRVAAGGLDR